MSKISNKDDFKTIISAVKRTDYVGLDFNGVLNDAIVLSMCDDEMIRDRIIHHPIGGHELKSDDWVISTRPEVAEMISRMKNPFGREIAVARWKSVKATLAKVFDKTFKLSEDEKKELLIKGQPLSFWQKKSKQDYSASLTSINGLNPIKKGGKPPVKPKLSETTVLFSITGDGIDPSAIAAMISLTSKDFIREYETSLGPQPYVTFKDDMETEKQVADPRFQGLSRRQVIGQMMKIISGHEVLKLDSPNDVKDEKESPIPEKEKEKGKKDETLAEKQKKFLEKVFKSGESDLPDTFKRFWSGDALKKIVEDSTYEFKNFESDVDDYPDLYAKYKQEAEKAAAERKKRYEEAISGV